MSSKAIKLYPNHIPISNVQRGVYTVGSAVQALMDPTRGDMVAILGETTGTRHLIRARDLMLEDPVGRRILRQRPIITSESINLQRLDTLPRCTFGKEYVEWLKSENATPDSRRLTTFVNDEELAYVMDRWRQVHDFWHTLTGLNVSVESEIALKWFEAVQGGFPVSWLSSLVGPLALDSRARLVDYYIPWALRAGKTSKFMLNIMYEDLMDMPLDEVRQQVNLEMPPKLRQPPAPQK
jgi:ubiquinone biosynthesis protein COQ4